MYPSNYKTSPYIKPVCDDQFDIVTTFVASKGPRGWIAGVIQHGGQKVLVWDLS